nr:hypothetical protein [Atlantibacter hermannii]
MPLYVGTVYSFAKPMTRAAYNSFRGWQLPSNENGDDEGYLVENQSGTANTPEFVGHVSWLPKEVFESAHTLVGNVNLPPFAQRIKGERVQLNDRIQKLVAFIGTDAFLALPFLEQGSLNSQLDYMLGYRRELDERLIRQIEKNS